MKKLLILLLSIFSVFSISCAKESLDSSSSSNSSVSSQVAKYNVTIENVTGGSISVSEQEVNEGDFVIINAVPSQDYELDYVTVNGEQISGDENGFVVYNVRSDLNISASFSKVALKVRFYTPDGSSVLYQKSEKAESITCEYVGPTPSLEMDATNYYTFDGWFDAKEGGNRVTNFTFTTSTDLYARFSSNPYTASMVSTLEVKPLSSASLNFTTDLNEEMGKPTFTSSNSKIAKVSADGKVTALKAGTCTITATLGKKELTTSVSVISTSQFKGVKVYGQGSGSYSDGVTTYSSLQADIVKLDGSYVNYDYVDLSCDIEIGADVTGNNGLQVHKNKNTDGGTKSAIQFNFITGTSNNVCLKRNGTDVAGTTTSYTITAGVTYNYRIVTSPSQTSAKTHVVCYINGDKVIDVDIDSVDSLGKICGLRLAETVTNKCANIELLDNTPEIVTYNVTTQAGVGGSISSTATIIEEGKSFSVSVTVENGYRVKSFKVNGEIVSLQDNSYQVASVDKDYAFVVEFELIPTFTIQTNASEGGSVTSNLSYVQEGGSFVITVTANDGYRVKSFKVNGVDKELTGSTYEITNVTANVEVTVEFEEIPVDNISVNFYNSDNTLISQQTIPSGSQVTNLPQATKASSGMKYYVFKEWRNKNGEGVTNFVFTEDVDLYAYYNELTYTLEIDKELELYALDEYVLTPTTNNPNQVTYHWESSDEGVIIVTDGKIYAVKVGTANVTVEVDGVTATCLVMVKVAQDLNITTVYGSGASYQDGVLTINSAQADIVDSTSAKVEMTDFELEINVRLTTSVGTGANFGIQFNKVENSLGNVSKAYMLKLMTTDQVATNNVVIAKNGTNVTATQNTFEIKSGTTYRVKISSQTTDSGRLIKYYINGTLICEYTDTSSALDNSLIGFRCASVLSGDGHLISIVSLKNLKTN